MPGKTVLLIGGSIEDLRIIPVDHHIDHTHIFIDMKYFFPCFPPIRGSENTTVFIGCKKGPHRSNIDNIFIPGMYDDLWNMLSLFQSHKLKGLPGIG